MFANGKSCSKKLHLIDEEEWERPRREKIDIQERNYRIEKSGYNKHTIQNYKLFDQLSAEVTTLKSNGVKLNAYNARNRDLLNILLLKLQEGIHMKVRKSRIQ